MTPPTLSRIGRRTLLQSRRVIRRLALVTILSVLSSCEFVRADSFFGTRKSRYIHMSVKNVYLNHNLGTSRVPIPHLT